MVNFTEFSFLNCKGVTNRVLVKDLLHSVYKKLNLPEIALYLAKHVNE